MGSYTDFTINGYPILETKSYAIPEVMTVFQDSDKCIEKRYLSDNRRTVDAVIRNLIVIGEAASYIPEDVCLEYPMDSSAHSAIQTHCLQSSGPDPGYGKPSGSCSGF